MTNLNLAKPYVLSFSKSQKLDYSFVSGLFCIAVFFLVNPFLAIFIIAIVSLYTDIPKWPYIISASLSFALFFYSREYGVVWAASSDDIPNYLIYFHSDDYLSINDIFLRFFSFPSGTEPLWHLLCWLLINLFNAGSNDFLFSYYWLLFVCLFTGFRYLSEKYFALFAIIFFFLTPASIDGLFHLWRQELALLIYLIGIGLAMVKRKKIGFILIYITPLFHLSFVFFVSLFFCFSFYKNKKITNTKFKYFIFLMSISALVSLFYFTGITILESTGVSAITGYFEGTTESKIRVFIVVVINAAILLYSFFKLNTDDLNKFFLVLFFPILGIMFAFPGSDSIYQRLYVAILPILGIYLFRCYLLNYPSKYLGLLILVIFLSGSVRLYFAYTTKLSCTQFLAYGHFFDPTMGFIKLLINM
jgi:hypothetical protein